MNLQKDNFNNSKSEVLLHFLRNNNKASKILVIGCEDGLFLTSLNKIGFHDVQGIDPNEEVIGSCKKLGIDNVILSNISNPDFQENYFDVIISLYSLQVIEKDVIALKNWIKLLKKSGELYVVAAAFDYLKNYKDISSLDCRRYTLHDLTEKICEAGFEIERESYLDFFVYFPTTLIRLIDIFKSKFFKGKSERLKTDFSLNINLMRFENFVIKKLAFPIGINVFVKAKK